MEEESNKKVAGSIISEQNVRYINRIEMTLTNLFIMLWLLWITQYYYLITDALQDTMEEWMKLLACSSHDYMKLMVYELQQKLAELDAIDVTSSRSCDFRENALRYIHVLNLWNCKTKIKYNIKILAIPYNCNILLDSHLIFIQWGQNLRS